MTRDFANQLDRTLEAIQALVESAPNDKKARAEVSYQISCLRDRIAIEPCQGDSLRGFFKWRW